MTLDFFLPGRCFALPGVPVGFSTLRRAAWRQTDPTA